MRQLCLGFVAVFSVLHSVIAAAQPPSATLRGRVHDAQGAAVANAAIAIADEGSGVARTATSDANGAFVVSNLSPGSVTLKVNAQGFGAITRTFVLEVAQVVAVEIELAVGPVRETVTVAASPVRVDTSRSVVDAVMPSSFIEALPLNGRNFLELAFLVPGNAPAPNFDPTKSSTVTISSAGQLGRGGNVMIDGADNNDDVVGGPLQNVSQEAVQEFQMATGRFTAESGRSASSMINVVTKSGTNDLHGSASLYSRNSRWQALPATYDGSSGRPPFDRQQYAGSAGGPLARSGAFWFGAIEYRNQDGGVLVGTRDLATRTITRSFASAPLNDLLGSARVDIHPNAANTIAVRYAGERVDDTGASTLDRAIGSASQRQASRNRYQSVVGSWTGIRGASMVNVASASFSVFGNEITPVTAGPQLTFPSIQDGTSFRVPQGTDQQRFQLSDSATFVRGAHTIRAGGEWQRVDAAFDLGVFREGRIEFVEDFATFDHNGDGRIDDNDLLFAVTLRSGKPDQSLTLPDADNNHVAMFVQDDWRVGPDLTLNLGLRYELDTDVKNVSRYAEINPLVQPFLVGDRKLDGNNFGPRIGFNWAPRGGRATSVHGGYGIYYDRVTLEIESLERGLDGRALPIEVRAGNTFFLDPGTGTFPPFAPSLGNPFTGFVLTGAGASGINIIDNRLQNPSVQQFNLGVQQQLPKGIVLRADGLHELGTHFIIGRTIGSVFNPVVGGPDRVVNLESSVNTHYNALLLSAEQRGAKIGFRASYTLAKAQNYANDDQIPFSNGPIDPNDLSKEFGPTPNDQRHRFTAAGWTTAPGGFLVSSIWTFASAVPIDILLPDGQSRVPVFTRNAGGREFKTGADLNRALSQINSSGGINGEPLPLVDEGLRFGDGFSAIDLRVSRPFSWGRTRLEPMFELFNVFNVTNILGTSVRNYSGFANVLVRDSNDPGNPGFLRSSAFGQPVATAGGVFGSGGPRALQLAIRVTY